MYIYRFYVHTRETHPVDSCFRNKMENGSLSFTFRDKPTKPPLLPFSTHFPQSLTLSHPFWLLTFSLWFFCWFFPLIFLLSLSLSLSAFLVFSFSRLCHFVSGTIHHWFVPALHTLYTIKNNHCKIKPMKL